MFPAAEATPFQATVDETRLMLHNAGDRMGERYRP